MRRHQLPGAAFVAVAGDDALLAVALTVRRCRSTLTVMRDLAAGVEHRFRCLLLQAGARLATDRGPCGRRHRGAP
jgi:hypothetical protein